jgi:hypothetical protein
MWKSRKTTRILASPGVVKKIVEYIGFSDWILGEFYDDYRTKEDQRAAEEEIDVGNSSQEDETE